MPDYSDYNLVIKLLEQAQDAERDNRELSQEDHEFVTDVNGQWEQSVFNSFADKPRYTFDQTSPIVDQISGHIDRLNFDISIKPAGSGATKDLAEIRAGLTRNIENVSRAQHIYAMAARNVIVSGADHWMVETTHLTEKSFDLDLIIKTIHNSLQRVWFDVGAQEQDRSDSDHGWLLSAIPLEQFKEKNPDRTGKSVDQGLHHSHRNHHNNKTESVIVGHFFFRKLVTKELLKTSLGRAVLNDEDFKKVEDELADGGETIVDRRKIKVSTFFMRKFDGEGWIGKEQETVFSSIPLIPVYGNYQVLGNKFLYRGVVRKLKDSQRVLNYSQSREIEEGALAPRDKAWMTKEQSEGNTATLATLNTNTDPVQTYTHVDGVPPPFMTGGAKINPGLRIITENMRAMMQSTAGIFAAGMGDNPGLQSGIAIQRLQDKTNNMTAGYISALEIAICRTATIMDEAFSKVYDVERQQQILSIDGSGETKVLNQAIVDEQTGDPVVLNDMSLGKFITTCTAGPSFSSRQDETVEAILRVAAVDPTVMQIGSDVFLSNIDAPGMDKIAERSRQQLLNAGVIPVDQMTEEEQQAAEIAAQQPQQPDAAILLAQAEQAKAQAEQTKADAQAQKVQVDLQKVQLENQKAQNRIALDVQKLQLAQRKIELDAQQRNIEFSEKIAKLDQATQKQEFDQLIALRDQQNQFANDAIDNLNTQANTMKTLADAIAVSPIQGPGNVASFIGQTREVIDAQNQT